MATTDKRKSILKQKNKTATKSAVRRAKQKITRRGRNEGTIYLRSDGRWCAMITLGTDDDGKRIRKSFYGDTRAEVSIKMTSLLGEKLKGGHASVTNDSLHTLMYEWLYTFKKAEVSARTFERTVGTAEKHIYPHIGELKLNEITPNVIQGVLNKMLLRGYALPTVRKVKFLLNQFFSYAKSCKFIRDNPVSECIVKSTKEHKEQKEEKYKAIPIEARSLFLEAISEDELMKPLCMIQMFAGLRIGEALALKWKDVNFDTETINIDNAVTIIPETDSNGKIIKRRTVISDTKTAASVREVPMPDILKNALTEWYGVRWALGRKTNISLTEADNLVFGTNCGKLRTYYGTKTMFERLMKKSGLSRYKLHFHSLRHTYSSMLFESHENPKVIQMLLGHKDVTTTIKTYNSVDRSYFKQAVDKLNAKFEKTIK